MTIINGTDADAAVKIRVAPGAKRTVRFVYVQAHSQTAIAHIGVGNYVLQFSLGTDWDRKARAFKQEDAFSEFLNALDFREEPTSNGIGYNTYEITLHPVLGGQAKTTGITKREFEDAPSG